MFLDTNFLQSHYQDTLVIHVLYFPCETPLLLYQPILLICLYKMLIHFYNHYKQEMLPNDFDQTEPHQYVYLNSAANLYVRILGMNKILMQPIYLHLTKHSNYT